MTKTLEDYFYEAAAQIKTARAGMEVLNLSKRETRVLSKFDAKWASALALFQHSPGDPDPFLRDLLEAAKAAQRLMEKDNALYVLAGEPRDYSWPLSQINIHLDELWSNWMQTLGGVEGVDAVSPTSRPSSCLRQGCASA